MLTWNESGTVLTRSSQKLKLFMNSTGVYFQPTVFLAPLTCPRLRGHEVLDTEGVGHPEV